MTTEDGYILMLHRVFKKDAPRQQESAPRKAIFLQHGMFDSSLLWIINDPMYAPAFKLANDGYDVWLGNNRGTTYSRKHIKYDAHRDRDYWDFSFAEQGLFDAPAQIDYIREKTGQEKVTYVGHSNGTTQFFHALASPNEDPDFWKKRINMFVAFNPVFSFKGFNIAMLRLLTFLTVYIRWSFFKMALWRQVFHRGVSVEHFKNKI